MTAKASIDKQWRIILVPHTHWDRELYFPYQRYRTRLVGRSVIPSRQGRCNRPRARNLFPPAMAFRSILNALVLGEKRFLASLGMTLVLWSSA